MNPSPNPRGGEPHDPPIGARAGPGSDRAGFAVGRMMLIVASVAVGLVFYLGIGSLLSWSFHRANAEMFREWASIYEAKGEPDRAAEAQRMAVIAEEEEREDLSRAWPALGLLGLGLTLGGWRLAIRSWRDPRSTGQPRAMTILSAACSAALWVILIGLGLAVVAFLGVYWFVLLDEG